MLAVVQVVLTIVDQVLEMAVALADKVAAEPAVIILIPQLKLVLLIEAVAAEVLVFVLKTIHLVQAVKEL